MKKVTRMEGTFSLEKGDVPIQFWTTSGRRWNFASLLKYSRPTGQYVMVSRLRVYTSSKVRGGALVPDHEDYPARMLTKSGEFDDSPEEEVRQINAMDSIFRQIAEKISREFFNEPLGEVKTVMFPCGCDVETFIDVLRARSDLFIYRETKRGTPEFERLKNIYGGPSKTKRKNK